MKQTKKIIKQNVDGIEKLLIVEILDEISVDDIKNKTEQANQSIIVLENEIKECLKQIVILDNKVQDLKQEQDNAREVIRENEDILNGVITEYREEKEEEPLGEDKKTNLPEVNLPSANTELTTTTTSAPSRVHRPFRRAF